MRPKVVTLADGGGGKSAAELVAKTFMPHLSNRYISALSDGAVLPPINGRLAFSTDSFVVDPIFFPGGDIGSLAVHGTVNDLAVSGAVPMYLSVGFILEEGFPLDDLEKIAKSMGNAAKQCSVSIVAGDTKVVARGSADKIFINSSGIGVVPDGVNISAERVGDGDVIILSGHIGDHGMAILSQRKGLKFDSPVISDSNPLNGLTETMLKVEPDIRMMRDPTRGGLAASLTEIAGASGKGMVIEEDAIPVNENVRAFCELLGMDVLHVANEGKLVAFAPSGSAGKLIDAMRSHPMGRHASIIGTVGGARPGTVEMKTSFLGRRIVDALVGDQLPRIC